MRHFTNCLTQATAFVALVLLLVLTVTAQEPELKEPSLTKQEKVKVDYSKPDAVAKAIKDAAFDWVKLDIAAQNIPLIHKGRITHDVLEIDFGRLVFDKDLPAELDKRGLAFADPLTAITYATKFPDRQTLRPINILFTDKQGHSCYLLLGGGPDRRFKTMPANVGHWGPGARFLVIRKSAVSKIIAAHK